MKAFGVGKIRLFEVDDVYDDCVEIHLRSDESGPSEDVVVVVTGQDLLRIAGAVEKVRNLG